MVRRWVQRAGAAALLAAITTGCVAAPGLQAMGPGPAAVPVSEGGAAAANGGGRATPSPIPDPAVAVSPTGAPGPLGAGWVDEAVRSRSVSCSVSATGGSPGAPGVVVEHLVCSVEMTDPRASGDLTADVTTSFEPASASAGTWDGTFTLTGEGGEWKGSGHGAAVRVPDADAPALFGEVTYHGARACGGLVYVQLLAGDPAPSTVTGWIVGPLPGADQWLARLGTMLVDTVALAGRRL